MRLRNYMVSQGFWDESAEKSLYAELTQEVNDAVARFEALTPPKPESIFDSLYETLPTIYEAQRDMVRKDGAR
jgi:pyruvate dehydrogenase E1 component alpha subunit